MNVTCNPIDEMTTGCRAVLPVSKFHHWSGDHRNWRLRLEEHLLQRPFETRNNLSLQSPRFHRQGQVHWLVLQRASHHRYFLVIVITKKKNWKKIEKNRKMYEGIEWFRHDRSWQFDGDCGNHHPHCPSALRRLRRCADAQERSTQRQRRLELLGQRQQPPRRWRTLSTRWNHRNDVRSNFFFCHRWSQLPFHWRCVELIAGDRWNWRILPSTTAAWPPIRISSSPKSSTAWNTSEGISPAWPPIYPSTGPKIASLTFSPTTILVSSCSQPTTKKDPTTSTPITFP